MTSSVCIFYKISIFKSMKPYILLLFIGLTMPVCATTQRQCSGIFKSAADYQRNSVTYIADTTRAKCIKTDNFFLRPYILIKTPDTILKVSRKDIFAVRMPNQKVFRLIDGRKYEILDTSNICIYSLEMEVIIPKKAVHTTHYEHKKRTGYFFSPTIADSVQELNIKNLRLALLRDTQLDRDLITFYKNKKSLLTRAENGQFDINILLNSIKKLNK